MWLLIPILLYCIVFFYVRHIYSYWRRRGFPAERSALSARFLCQAYKRESQLIEAISDVYKQTSERFLGIYMFFRPTLLVRDIELARDILENTERCFHESRWDFVQAYRRINLLDKIRPAFTRELCQDMFESVEKVGDNMLAYIAEHSKSDQEIICMDMEEIIRTYSNDIIGNLIYGLNVNSFKFPDNIFNQHIMNVRRPVGYASTFSFVQNWRRNQHLIRLRELLLETVKHRELQNTVRKDFLQLFIKIRNAQNIAKQEPCDIWNIELVPECEKYLSMEAISELVEKLMSMGLEPIAKTAEFTLLEVLEQPDILQKILHEIVDTQKKHKLEGDKLSFEALRDLRFLDMCIKETLRKYPGVPMIKRICRKEYRLPGTKYVLEYDCNILIPVRDIQRNEQYFAEPLLYKPERFAETDAQEKYRAYIPFGLGARACIAQLLSNVVVKVLLAKLLLRYKPEPTHNAYADAARKCAKVNLKRRKI